MLEYGRRQSLWFVVFWVVALTSLYISKFAGEGRVWFLGMSVILGGVALIFTADYIVGLLIVRLVGMRQAMTITPENKFLELARSLSDRQAAMIQSLDPAIINMPNSAEPAWWLNIGDCQIPFQFIDQFLLAGTGEYLCPVGVFSEGSGEREYAVALTGYFVLFGWAEPARGNKPAKWLRRSEAEHFIGIDAVRRLYE